MASLGWQDERGPGAEEGSRGDTYTDEVPETAKRLKCRVCTALRLAAAGSVMVMTAENSACPGGSRYLGLAEPAPEGARALRDFLINGEKLLSCPAAIHRSGALTKAQPPLGAADYVLFAPLAQAPLAPDVVVFICNPAQGARLVHLADHETGLPMECDPTGALCRSAITYPLVTGQVNVTFGDITARRFEGFADDELFVTLPLAHLRSAAASLDRCSAGTAPVEIPPEFRRLLQEGEAAEG